MAKFGTAIIAVALFCLLTLTLAGTLPEKDETTTQVSLPISEAAKPAVRLPSQSSNLETSPNSAVVSSLPLTKVPFRPVNRRFHIRSKHPCRHHFRYYPTARENVEVPYGNDMIISTGENSDFQEPVLHGEGRSVPVRWIRMHHHHRHHDEERDSNDDADGDRLKKIVLKRYDYNKFHRVKMLKKLRKHFREEEEKQKKGGFMKRVRKFLDHYF